MAEAAHATRGASGPRIGRQLLIVAVCAFALVALWPAKLGGSVSWVIVRGTSMEPTYHSGDLLYARSTSRFRVGDPAVYRVPAGRAGAGQLVVHRIRGRNRDGRWVTRGDNRLTDDGTLPNQRDLVARPIVNLGRVPTRMLLLLPWTTMLVAAVTFGWYLWPRRGDFTPNNPALNNLALHDLTLNDLTLNDLTLNDLTLNNLTPESLRWRQPNVRLGYPALVVTVLGLALLSVGVFGTDRSTSNPHIAPTVTWSSSIPTVPQPTWAPCTAANCG